MTSRPLILLLLGTSGAGKSSVKQYLQSACDFESAPKFTTRRSRGTVDDERDFIFCAEDQMPSEDVLRFESYGALFGIQLDKLESSLHSGRDHVLTVGDTATIGTIRALYPHRVFTALVHCSRDELRRRIEAADASHRTDRWPTIELELRSVYEWLGTVDFVLHNSGPLEDTFSQLVRLLLMLKPLRETLPVL